jgi:hypothetical protein
MKKLPLLLVLSALLIFSSSCKKDDTAPPTRADILASKVWRITEHTVNPGRQAQGGQIVTNLFQYYGTTYQDDLVRFNRNPNTYTFEEGATKSDPIGDQVFNAGTWMLNSDESVLVLHSANGQFFSYGQIVPVSEEEVIIVSQGDATHLTNYNIVELTATTLKYSYAYRLQQNGPTYTETLTYTAQ